MEEGTPCAVRDGKFLEPCFGLASSVAEASFKASGIHIRSLMDLKKREPSRTFAVVRTKGGDRHDIILNFCPFCGERIDAPWREEMEEPTPAPAPKTEEPASYIYTPLEGSNITRAIRGALVEAIYIAGTVKFIFNDWETTVRPGDTEQGLYARYQKFLEQRRVK